MAQRLPDQRDFALSVLLSVILPIVMVFSVYGMLLWGQYRRAEITRLCATESMLPLFRDDGNFCKSKSGDVLSVPFKHNDPYP